MAALGPDPAVQQALAAVRDAAGPSSVLEMEWRGSDYRKWKRAKLDEETGAVVEL